MATKNEVEKKGFMGFMAKVGKFFKSLPGRIARSFREMFAELKKVTWPTKKDMINYSLVVLAFVVVMGVIIGVIDLGAGKLVDVLVRAGA